MHHLNPEVFHVPILGTPLYYSHFCLCLSTHRPLCRRSKHKLLSQSLIKHFWKRPLANVLTSTQTPRLRSTRRPVTLCHHLPSKQKHARRHYWSHNLLLLNASMMMSILPLARDRVDEGANAPANVPMSHIHHATIAVIHNRNSVWCWLSQASIQHEIPSSNL